MFGDIKIFGYPMFLVYDPSDYEITGKEILKVLRTIQEGDVVIRGYNHYLDGKFIPSKEGWSHAGLYIGNNSIIHAVAEGVSRINIIDFMQCDRICVLRPSKNKVKAIMKAKEFLRNKIPYDFGFKNDVSELYCFELAGICYEDLDIKKMTASLLGGLIKKKEKVYLAESFLNSPDFKVIFKFNPKYDKKDEKSSEE